MKIQEALEINQNWTAEQARNDLERLLLTGERPADKVIALACKALEKQIPILHDCVYFFSIAPIAKRQRLMSLEKEYLIWKKV